MRILITGNLGYVGPEVVRRLRMSYPEATLIGFDMGYFAECLTIGDASPECRVDVQHFGDVRQFPRDLLEGVDAAVHLAAISNDPMGASFEDVTMEINHRASVQIARLAKEMGVRSFVFASSCSVYGLATDEARNEGHPVNPLTAYARSKIMTEQVLADLASDLFTVTCLRFATACGMSHRLRLDLVLNDFVASALTAGRITILSDGTPWRPLIHVKDMARAIDWAVGRRGQQGGSFLAVNTGSDQWNYQVKALAEAVVRHLPTADIQVNSNAQPDKRSYRVSFARFADLAGGYLPQITLADAIADLIAGLRGIGFADANFRTSRLVRLNRIRQLKESGHLTEHLEWAHSPQLMTARPAELVTS